MSKATKPLSGESHGWTGLLPELFDRIADNLNLQEGGKALPLVCKAWNRMHKERLASLNECSFCQPISAAKLELFRLAAPGMEDLSIYPPEPEDGKKKGLLTRMLAIPAPKLRSLYLDCGDQDTSALCSLSRLTHLTELSLEVKWSPKTPRKAGDLARLSNLRSLEAFHLEGVSMWVPEEWSAALWNSLAALPHLHKVGVAVRNDRARWMRKSTFPNDDLGPFLRHLSTLTAIKSLRLEKSGFLDSGWTNCRGTLYASISPLKQLTALDLGFRLGPDKARRLQLPLLQSLELFFTQKCIPAKEHACIDSTTLTHLALRGDTDAPLGDYKRTVAQLLPPTTPALANLRSLHLAGCMLEELPPSVVSALPRLTSLQWCQTEMKALFPALSAVTLITSLVELDLSDNQEWDVAGEDPTPLRSLPCLTKLVLEGISLVNNEEDFLELRKKLPG